MGTDHQVQACQTVIKFINHDQNFGKNEDTQPVIKFINHDQNFGKNQDTRFLHFK